MVDGAFVKGSRFRTITLTYPRPSILNIPGGGDFWDHLSLLNERPVHASRFCIDATHTPSPPSLPPFAPPIRHLHLSYFQFNWSQNFFPNTLETLVIEESGEMDVSTAHVLRLMNSFRIGRSLRSLSLVRVALGDRGISQADICELDQLEYFSLEGFYVWEAVQLLNSILTPHLRHLSMNRILSNGPSGAGEAAWKTVRFPRLQKLTLQNVGGDVDFDQLVELIPNLPDSLRCVEVIDTDPIATLLLPSSSTFCGQLHHLSARDVPLNTLLPFVGLNCASLQELEASYCTIAEALDDFMEITGFNTDVGLLKTRGVKLQILVDGEDPEADEPTCFTFEELKSSGLGGPAPRPVSYHSCVLCHKIPGRGRRYRM